MIPILRRTEIGRAVRGAAPTLLPRRKLCLTAGSQHDAASPPATRRIDGVLRSLFTRGIARAAAISSAVLSLPVSASDLGAARAARAASGIGSSRVLTAIESADVLCSGW